MVQMLLRVQPFSDIPYNDKTRKDYLVCRTPYSDLDMHPQRASPHFFPFHHHFVDRNGLGSVTSKMTYAPATRGRVCGGQSCAGPT